MIDSNLLLDQPDAVVAALARKGVSSETVLSARQALIQRRSILSEVEGLRAEMNRRSKQVGKLISSGDPSAEQERLALADLKSRIAEKEAELREAEKNSRSHLLMLPNLPSPEAPEGLDESCNVILRVEGPPADRFNPADYRPHWEIAAALGIYDPERAAKLSGSGFSLLYGDGARLIRALIQFGLDLNRDTYREVLVPHMVRSEVFEGTGHLPKFAEDAYNTTLDDLWLVPTGEVPLTGMHRGELFEADELPKRYMAYSVCFRREAGSAGKDTRGLQRLHEFHKVELVRICTPETVQDEFDGLLADAEKPLQLLELPYRVVDLAAGDLTFSSSRIFDLEVYSPGVDRWLEVSSVGNFTDFQPRRSNIRYRVGSGQTRAPYYLNGSALATPRMWAAVIEHGQRQDGTVELPSALVPYMGGKKVLEPEM
ncbi:serine--tRNA ligase [Micromonospora sp. HNM0581]|uniref:serine--tRNA ligase n=1 Tax=Micromonospora sp. HNM0581 TaxID=2716341 RepID=UPI00146BA757|nr:serine--tRNA ligase [Micromonospora sp. HNM0581]